MASWKAMHKWPSLKWWSYNHGHRTIPVELGTDSTNTWSETTMLLHTFMTDYMQPSLNQGTDAEVAYIAQHPLFDQMPSLVHDFEQPELMGGEAMLMNAWIGTKGTVTPLHFDSYDNFLAQVHTWHCSSDCCTSIMADSGSNTQPSACVKSSRVIIFHLTKVILPKTCGSCCTQTLVLLLASVLDTVHYCDVCLLMYV